MNVIYKFIVVCMGAMGLLLSFVQQVALWTRNKWIVVGTIFATLIGGFYVYTIWGKQGAYFLFGGLLVLTLIGSGLYQISESALEKVNIIKVKYQIRYK